MYAFNIPIKYLKYENFYKSFSKIIENKLTMENAGKGLSLLCKTASGLSHAYVRLDVHEK